MHNLKAMVVDPGIPYSGNLVPVKTFAIFAVSGKFTKDLTEEILIEYGGVIINGRVVVFPTIHGSFNRENPTFSNSRKFSPPKDSRYTISGCPVSPTDCHTSCSN